MKTYFAADFDMVLANSHPVWVDDLRKEFGVYSLDHYEICIKDTHWTDIAHFINGKLLECSDDIEPIEDSIKILPDILKYFNQDHLPIITSRYLYLYDCTEQWCKRHLPIPFKLYFADGIDNDKSKMIIKNSCYFVDDRLKTVNDIAPFVSRAFLINYPWNNGRQILPNVERINNLADILEYLKNDLHKISFL